MFVDAKSIYNDSQVKRLHVPYARNIVLINNLLPYNVVSDLNKKSVKSEEKKLDLTKVET